MTRYNFGAALLGEISTVLHIAAPGGGGFKIAMKLGRIRM